MGRRLPPPGVNPFLILCVLLFQAGGGISDTASPCWRKPGGRDHRIACYSESGMSRARDC